ncbi:MAG: protein ImuB [Acidimicrobiaceae bacterium]|nr:protein ImuB [Acidimicrobiaceae bacterium]
MVPTRTLVLWCPDWPTAAAGIAADVAAAVFKANRVVACSAAARAEGVQRGLRRREAQARCPGLVMLEHDQARNGRAFEPLVAAVEAFAPRVEILRPGVCLAPTRGPSRYFGGDQALAARVADAVGSTTGHHCLTGIADGPFAAVLAARQGRVVPSGESGAFLAPFPVLVLERPDLVDLLTRLGIRTLGQLAALPVEDVLARFGAEGVAAHRLAQGLDERPLALKSPPPDLIVQCELDPPAQRVDTAAFAGKALADELHARLADRGLACTRLAIEAETEHGEGLRRLWRHHGALSASAMAERVRWQLDGWLSGTVLGPARSGDGEMEGDLPDPTGGLTLLRLVPDEVWADNGRQPGFWGGGEGDERAARAMARVQGILGPEAVVTAVLSGGRDPMEQATLVPWGDVREPARLPPAALVPGSARRPKPAKPAPADSPGDSPGERKSTGRSRRRRRRPPPTTPADTPTADTPTADTPTADTPTADTPTASPDTPGPDTPGPGTDTPGPGPGPGPGPDTPTPGPDTPDPTGPKPRRARRFRRRTQAAEALAPPWPGHVPGPAPTVVYPRPLRAEVHDAAGTPVAITGRHALSAPPARLSVGGGRWVELTGWAGPWPVDERWWDGDAHRRRVRFQALTAAGAAYLLAVEGGSWRVEAAYD